MTIYQKKLQEVVDFIESNLDKNFSVDELSKLAGLSKYHFHRQFTAYFGVPVISMIRLLRLKRAAFKLSFRSDSNILAIALENGFESHEAFSRSFKKHFGQSPSEFKQSADWSIWNKKYESIIKLRKKVMAINERFDVKIVDFPEVNLAVMEHRGAPIFLNETIQKFIAWRKSSGLPPSRSRTFNLIYDDPRVTEPNDFRFDLGCAISDAIKLSESDIQNKVIPSGKCAMIRHIGSDDSIGVAVDYLYSQWIEQSNFELRDFPLFFERVSFFPEVPENEMITDIYLPIS